MAKKKQQTGKEVPSENDTTIRPGQGKDHPTTRQEDKELDNRSNKGRNKNTHP